MAGELEELVDLAANGDKAALEAVIIQIQGRVHGLALRMLFSPADAEDATQEILVKVITHLADFRGESGFMTWVWRIAANHLLTMRRVKAERREINFDQCSADVDQGLAKSGASPWPNGEQALMAEETMLACLHGVLLCLDRDHRLAFILGELFEVSGEEGAEILDIQPATYRKRLSRARKSLRDFFKNKCGVYEPDNPCRCEKQAAWAVRSGWVDPRGRPFSSRLKPSEVETNGQEWSRELDELGRVTALYRRRADFSVSEAFLRDLRMVLESGKFNRGLPH